MSIYSQVWCTGFLGRMTHHYVSWYKMTVVIVCLTENVNRTMRYSLLVIDCTGCTKSLLVRVHTSKKSAQLAVRYYSQGAILILVHFTQVSEFSWRLAKDSRLYGHLYLTFCTTDFGYRYLPCFKHVDHKMLTCVIVHMMCIQQSNITLCHTKFTCIYHLINLYI